MHIFFGDTHSKLTIDTILFLFVRVFLNKVNDYRIFWKLAVFFSFYFINFYTCLHFEYMSCVAFVCVFNLNKYLNKLNKFKHFPILQIRNDFVFFSRCLCSCYKLVSNSYLVLWTLTVVGKNLSNWFTVWTVFIPSLVWPPLLVPSTATAWTTEITKIKISIKNMWRNEEEQNDFKKCRVLLPAGVSDNFFNIGTTIAATTKETTQSTNATAAAAAATAASKAASQTSKTTLGGTSNTEQFS